MSSEESQTEEQQPASEQITAAELFALCGSAGHDSNGHGLDEALEALGELHPAAAGGLVRMIRRGIDNNDVAKYGTASSSEHPDWHSALQTAKSQSDKEGYDV